ncbi:hypothetical protein phiAS5_ORF0249 [Aeromonas phage phiAS5]|uniref:Uncharacterized protein n=1 Tax=Aeromonas phage phiAS5 TaxID=879630 RepID=E1A203_9CAUD|nr:hypothetical protein phiAS5_ORF0249 [Aeromonas phage phiAS5]ADM80092.1 hypothetical protein phiAS5_ORF0249 [Aeromonas phage phiAS5]BES53144.1 hypothetical protein [Aeromonas phage phiWae14]
MKFYPFVSAAGVSRVDYTVSYATAEEATNAGRNIMIGNMRKWKNYGYYSSGKTVVMGERLI